MIYTRNMFRDDFSEDGTLEWILVQMKRDKNIKFYRNKGQREWD